MSSDKTTTDLAVFQFENAELRTRIDADGLLWWLAADVCAVLHVSNVAKAVSRLDDDEKGITLSYTPSGVQEVLMINEAGLYNLILSSRKKKLPDVRRFKRWVTHEVLPDIRRTGTYAMPARTEVLRSNHLAPQPYPIRERAHISTYLLAVWTTLRQAEDPLSNAEISAKTAMKVSTVRKWTRYLLYLGVVDMYETCPEHLFEIPPQADKRHAGYFQRLERLAAMMEQRQQRLFT